MLCQREVNVFEEEFPCRVAWFIGDVSKKIVNWYHKNMI